jgi:hypothetical protein
MHTETFRSCAAGRISSPMTSIYAHVFFLNSAPTSGPSMFANASVQRAERKVCHTKRQWAYLPIIRYLTFGFNDQHVDCIFESLPSNVALEFRRILRKVDCILCSRIQYLKRFKKLCTPTTEESEAYDFEAELWKQQNICGYLKVTYEPSTQEPTRVQLNEKLAKYSGISCEEYPKCIADRSLPLPYPALDFLFLMIHETKLSTQCRTDR